MSVKFQVKGFSVLESMVSVAIIGIMAASMWIGYGNWRSRSALNAAAQKVAADVRRVQNLAVSTSQIEYPPGSGTMIIPCGYGIHYSDFDTYILFANIQDGLETDCSDSNKIYGAITDINMETINIEQRNTGFSGPFMDVLFFPPDPVTFINNRSDPGDATTLRLCVSGGSLCKSIEVRETGMVDIK